MARLRRFLPHVLFASGVTLVLAGLGAAHGWSTAGIFASVSAVAALLYVGAVWFGESPSTASARCEVLLFDEAMRLLAGPARSSSVLSVFPDDHHADVARACAAALAGEFTRFSLEGVQFSAVPIRAGDGRVVYGMLTTAEAIARRGAVLSASALLH